MPSAWSPELSGGGARLPRVGPRDHCRQQELWVHLGWTDEQLVQPRHGLWRAAELDVERLHSGAQLGQVAPYVPTAWQLGRYVYVASKLLWLRMTYQIHHNGTRDDRVLNQNIYYNKWVSLGTFYFSGGSNEYVYLGDNTGEPYATR